MKNEHEPIPVSGIPEAEQEITVVEEESKGKRVLNTIVNVVLVIAIALAAICTYVSYVSTSGNGVPNIFGIRMFSIQTESMYPTLLPGDLIFDVGVKDPGELRRDDIITYWTVINGERVLNTHRIYEIYDGGGYLIFSTKGDNNTSADPLTVHESEIVGKYALRVPGVGKVFDYLQTSTGFLIVIVIPVFLFFLFHLVQFFRVLFEYQNVKNRIKFEQERGRTEDLIEEQQKKQQQQMDAAAEARAKMEAEIRERLRAEILASMAAQQAQPAPAPVAEPAPAAVEAEAEPAVTAKETSVTEETVLEEVPAEEEPAPAEEPAEEEVLEAKEAPEEAVLEAKEAPEEAVLEAEEVPEEEASEKEETPAEEKAEDKTEEAAEV